MPGTITTDQTVIDAADATTNWSVIGSWSTAIAVNDDPRLQGTNCIEGRNSNTTGWAGASAGGIDLTDGRHVFLWANNNCTFATDTVANGGQGVFICSDSAMTLTGTTPSNGPNNSKQWYLNGSDSEFITGGWVCYVVDPTSTPSLTLGTPVVTGINRIGLRIKTISTVTTKTRNIFFDVCRVGTGLTIKDGTSGAPVGFVDIFTVDKNQSNAYGVLTQVAGIYYGSGKLSFGSMSQTAVTYFKDTNKTIVYRNFPVANTFYEIIVVGTSSYITTFQLGTYSGGLASGGCTIKGAGDTASTSHGTWTFSGNNAYAVTKLYNSSLSEMRRGLFNSASEIRYCSFSNFGDITTNGALIDNCTFQNVKTTAPISGTYALILNAASEATPITNCKFINCNRAIKITAAGTYDFSNLTFSGNTYDIENSSAGAVIIQTSNGSNPTTYINTGGGSVSIQTSATLTINIVDADGVAITAACEVTVVKISDTSELYHAESITTGTTNYVYTTGGGTATYINVHNVTGYTNRTVYQTLPSSGTTTLTIQLDDDRMFSNP